MLQSREMHCKRLKWMGCLSHRRRQTLRIREYITVTQDSNNNVHAIANMSWLNIVWLASASSFRVIYHEDRNTQFGSPRRGGVLLRSAKRRTAGELRRGAARAGSRAAKGRVVAGAELDQLISARMKQEPDAGGRVDRRHYDSRSPARPRGPAEKAKCTPEPEAGIRLRLVRWPAAGVIVSPKRLPGRQPIRLPWTVMEDPGIEYYCPVL